MTKRKKKLPAKADPEAHGEEFEPSVHPGAMEQAPTPAPVNPPADDEGPSVNDCAEYLAARTAQDKDYWLNAIAKAANPHVADVHAKDEPRGLTCPNCGRSFSIDAFERREEDDDVRG